MTATLRFDHPIGLVGGGELQPDDLALTAARVGAMIAADGGANAFAADDAPPLDAIIGDMDSVADLARWRATPGVRVLAIAEQDTTDFEKCLYSVDAPLFLAAGFFGARLDHTLAALHALMRWPSKRVVMLGARDVAFLAPLELALDLVVGARVSIFPLAPCRGVGSSGLRWPIDGVAFELGRQSGTSNEAASARVTARFDARGALILLERRFLDAALAAVQRGQ